MDNFDLRKYLAEGRLFEKVETKNFNLGSAKMEVETDEDGAMAYLKGKSGNYDGFVEDGKVSFSISYDDREDDIDDFYNEKLENIPLEAFSHQLINKELLLD